MGPYEGMPKKRSLFVGIASVRLMAPRTCKISPKTQSLFVSVVRDIRAVLVSVLALVEDTKPLRGHSKEAGIKPLLLGSARPKIRGLFVGIAIWSG